MFDFYLLVIYCQRLEVGGWVVVQSNIFIFGDKNVEFNIESSV